MVVTLWHGPLVVARLVPGDGLTDSEIVTRLKAYGIAIPDTPEARLARYDEWPTPADLAVLEDAYVAMNGGVRPVARVLETMAAGGMLTAAGAVPR